MISLLYIGAAISASFMVTFSITAWYLGHKEGPESAVRFKNLTCLDYLCKKYNLSKKAVKALIKHRKMVDAIRTNAMNKRLQNQRGK